MVFYFAVNRTVQVCKAFIPFMVDQLYVYPVKRLARIVGDGFLKDFALGKAFIHKNALPNDVQDLFLPEELFYATKRRYYR